MLHLQIISFVFRSLVCVFEGFDRMIRTNLSNSSAPSLRSCIVLAIRFRLDIDLSAEDHPPGILNVTEIHKEVNKYRV